MYIITSQIAYWIREVIPFFLTRNAFSQKKIDCKSSLSSEIFEPIANDRAQNVTAIYIVPRLIHCICGKTDVLYANTREKRDKITITSGVSFLARVLNTPMCC